MYVTFVGIRHKKSPNGLTYQKYDISMITLKLIALITGSKVSNFTGDKGTTKTKKSKDKT